jgi:hypothetical protein
LWNAIKPKGHIMQPHSEPPTGVGEELRSDAQHVGQTTVNRLHSEVDARKGSAASQAKSVSSAIDRAAGELDDGAPDWLKSAFRQGAQQVQRFADALEQKDSRQLIGDVSNFARNSPGTFLAACAAAGFAAARLAKVAADGSAGSSSTRGSSQYRSSFDSTFGRSDMKPETTTAPGEFA